MLVTILSQTSTAAVLFQNQPSKAYHGDYSSSCTPQQGGQQAGTSHKCDSADDGPLVGHQAGLALLRNMLSENADSEQLFQVPCMGKLIAVLAGDG